MTSSRPASPLAAYFFISPEFPPTLTFPLPPTVPAFSIWHGLTHPVVRMRTTRINTLSSFEYFMTVGAGFGYRNIETLTDYP